ncbi:MULTISPECIES: cupin domain-containing protein [Pseudomonas]|uniref:cupin domain-containing protein n=1 Tax=Pseudomonas TaxID=286 RepID=UPI002DBC22F1|nr:cupin domain-containing protein [Pseudomonas asiatica]MEB6589147.1 cupin domain-containing protein [Pseudomonas asiatica]
MSLIRICLDDSPGFSEPTVLGDAGAQARTAAHRTLPDGKGTTGVWECTPGSFRRQVAQAEYSYIVAGEGSFTPEQGLPVEFQAGDALYFPANTQGTWVIRKTVRKTYLILE